MKGTRSVEMFAPEGEQGRAERFIHREGHGRDEDSGLSPRRTSRRRGIGMLRKPSGKQGRSHLIAGTTVYLSRSISPLHTKSEAKPSEKSEGTILLRMVETTELHRREGPLLQPCPSRR